MRTSGSIPLFIGYPEFVRGYGVNSFERRRVRDQRVACPTFDRLVGSRMLVGQHRVPLPAAAAVRRETDRMYGPLPVEVAFFLDGGVAWNKGQKPSFFNGGTREPVTSGGISLRTNLLGFAVAQIDYATSVRSARQRLGLGVFTHAGILTLTGMQWQGRWQRTGRLVCHLHSAICPDRRATALV